ncbi:MAG: hypothetical protein GC204_09940 [Chloroflexi bacterium]|nr:hypothetical protein [Chloroflexota bacterium]
MAALNDPLDSISAVKTRLADLSNAEFEQLRNVYSDRFIHWLAHSTGRWNLILGLLTVWLGWSGLSYDTLHLFQLFIGILTLGVSLWASAKPSVQVIRAFSGVFLIGGIWNLFLVVQNNFQGLSFLVGLLGLAQLWWAFQYNHVYQIHRASVPNEPSVAADQLYDQIWQAVCLTKAQQDADFVEFQIGSNRWQGWLLGSLAVLGLKKGKIFHLIRETEITLKPNVAIGKKKRFYANIKFDDISARARISNQSFEKYAQWKLRNNPTASPEALQLDGTRKGDWLPFSYLPTPLRIPLIIIGALVLLGALCTLVLIIVTFIQYG